MALKTTDNYLVVYKNIPGLTGDIFNYFLP